MAPSAAATSATVGADTLGTSGMAYAGTGRSGSVIGSVTRLAITASTVAPRSARSWYAPRTADATAAGSCPKPSTTGTTTLPNSVASRALKASSRGRAGSPGSSKSLPTTTTAGHCRSTAR